jgi:hypothetical protein
MSNKREADQKLAHAAMKEFLKKGGTIQVIPVGQRTEPADQKSQWGRPKKKTNIPTALD